MSSLSYRSLFVLFFIRDISRNIPVIGSMVLHSRIGHIHLHCCFLQQTSAVKARLLVVRSHSCACISVIENVTNDLLSRAAGHDVVGSVRRRIWRHIRGTCYIPPRARPTAYPGCQRGSIYLSSWHRRGAIADQRSSYAVFPFDDSDGRRSVQLGGCLDILHNSLTSVVLSVVYQLVIELSVSEYRVLIACLTNYCLTLRH